MLLLWHYKTYYRQVRQPADDQEVFLDLLLMHYDSDAV